MSSIGTASDEDLRVWRQAAAHTAALYRKSLLKHRSSHSAVRWGSRASQMIRFRILASVGDLNGKCILDVGAGLADLYAYLTDEGIDVRYSGCDISKDMVQEAQARFPDIDFNQCDLLTMTSDELRIPRFDYVLASGIFTFCQYKPYAFLLEMVRRMMNLARFGVAFNCLSTWGERPDPGECQFDPVKCLALMRPISERIALRHDYLPHDFTVFLHKGAG